jgi:DNA polymerase I-like protein with 3'-5' exonuclease and polymerase domains
LSHAIFRGRYSRAVARIERAGIPVDRESYGRLIRNRELPKSRLIAEFELEYGPSPYVQNQQGVHTFSFRKLEAFLAETRLLPIWRKTPKSRLKTSEDYLNEMARQHRALHPLSRNFLFDRFTPGSV